MQGYRLGDISTIIKKKEAAEVNDGSGTGNGIGVDNQQQQSDDSNNNDKSPNEKPHKLTSYSLKERRLYKWQSN
jgi:hypothetical protein